MRNILRDQLWKYDSEGHIGNGSSVDAAIHEGQTGQASGARKLFHEDTLVHSEQGLNKVLAQTDLSDSDREVAYAARGYAQQGLRQFDLGVQSGRFQVGNGAGELDPERAAAALDRAQALQIGAGVDAESAWEPSGQYGPGATDPSGSGGAGGDDAEVPDA